MRVRFCLLWGGAFCWLCRRLHHRLPPAVRSKRYADASDLAIALDVATVLVRPVLLMRLIPPTLNQRGGGDFNANFGSADLVGTCDFYFLLVIGKGKLSYSLGDAVSVVIHDRMIFSLPLTL